MIISFAVASTANGLFWSLWCLLKGRDTLRRVFCCDSRCLADERDKQSEKTGSQSDTAAVAEQRLAAIQQELEAMRP